MVKNILGRLLSPPIVRVLVYWTSTRFTSGSLVIWTDDSRVLLVRSRYGERAWGFPGGVMDRREEPVECAVRELLEETGVEVAVADLTLAGCHTQQHARHIDHVYRLERQPDDAVGANTSDRFEIAEVAWWPIDELPRLRREAGRVVERYL